MARTRRLLRLVSGLAIALVGLLIVSLVVTQTSWFRDWLRRTAMRQAERAIDGQLVIGRLEGSLFGGVTLRDVEIVQDGAAVVSIARVEVDYGLSALLSEARVIGQLRVERPVIRAVRSPSGWNLARLLKPRPPSQPGSPRPTFSLPDIRMTDAQVLVEAAGAEPHEAIPRRIDGLHFAGGVTSGGDTLAIDIRELRLQASSPDLSLASLTGRVVNDRAGWHLDGLDVRTGASTLAVDGSLTRDAPDAPLTFALDIAGQPVSLPEVGRFLPVVASIDVSPRLEARVDGPLDALRVDLDMTSAAGNARGPVTLDLTGPNRGAAGDVRVSNVDLAPWVGTADAAGRITGAATFDLRFPSSTPGVALDGTFRFEGPTARAYGFAATNVVASGRLQGRRIELDARASAYGGQATTRGAIVRPARAGDAIVLSLAGRVSGVDLDRLPPELAVPPLDTSFTGAYTVEGPVPRLQLTAALDASTVEGARLAEGFTASFDRAPGGYTFRADGDVADLDLPRLGRGLDLPALADERWAGTIAGTFHVEGVKAAPDAPVAVTAAGELRDTAVFGGRVPQMAVTADLQGDVLRAEARGTFAGYDLATLSGVSALTGTLSGQVDATITFEDLDLVTLETVAIDGTVQLQRPTLIDVPFTQVEAEIALAGGVLDVRRLRGTGDRFTLTGDGTLALGSAGVSDFGYRLEAPSIVDPARIADLPLTGEVTTEGRITGPREAFRAAGSLTGTGVAYDEIVRADTVTADYTVDLPDLDPDRIRVVTTIAAGPTEIEVLAFETVDGRVEYTPGTVGFDVTATDGQRTVRGDGVMALGDGEQVVTLQALALERDGLRWATAPSTAGDEPTLTIRPQSIEIAPLTLVNGGQQLDLAGRVALADEATHDLVVEARAVDVGDALVLAGQDIDADGTLSLSGRIGGSGRLPTATGTLDVTAARFRGVSIEQIQATIEDDAGAARVDVLLRQSDRASLTATGRVPRTLFLPSDTTEVPASIDDTLDLTIRSTAVDLALAEGITSELTDLTGTARLDLHLTNTGRTPVVSGDVTVTDAGFRVARTGVQYQQVGAVVAFENDRALVQSFSAQSANGQPLTARGEIGLRNARKGQVALEVTGKGVRVLDNELGVADIDASLELSGTMYAPVIEGEVVVAEGRLELDALLPRISLGTYDTKADYQGIPTYASADAPPVVPDILDPAVRDQDVIYAVAPPAAAAASSASAAAPAAEGTPDPGSQPIAPEFVYRDMAINLRVRIPDNLVLRGRNVEVGRSGIGDINVTMGGDFRVAKPSGEPLVLIGAVNTVRGTYAYQGRRFDIARDGQVLFRGDGTTNPTIDITAERVIQGVEARVRVQGTADDPRISLSSDPPLDEADVLALIVFNQPLNQLGTGQQNSLAQRAGGIAAGLAISPIAQALGNTLDLDLFDVETTDQAGRVNPAVVIGQQVNAQLFVKFRQQFGNQQVSQFLLEYRLADFLRLQANAAEGDGLSRGNRSLTQRIERYGADLVFYFAF